MTIVLMPPPEGNPCLIDDAPPAEPTLPLADWLRAEASWYRQHDGPASELIAETILDLAHAAEFHAAASVADLVARSGRLRRCKLDEPTEPVDSRLSWLADAIEDERAGYELPGSGDASRLVAWRLSQLAWEADYYRAATEAEFRSAQRRNDERAREALNI